MCLYVRHLYPHPAAGNDFPCYLPELNAARLLLPNLEYQEYLSTIIVLYGENKWDSYEVKHTRGEVENVNEDDFGRYTKLLIQALINNIIQVMKSKGVDITGTPISYKTYRHSYPLKMIRKSHLITPDTIH